MVLTIVYIVDILLIPIYVYLYKWWDREHNRPGLAEMTDGRSIVVGLIIEIILFLVLTAVLMIQYYKNKRKRIYNKGVKKKVLIIAGIIVLSFILSIGILALSQLKKSRNVIGKVYGAEHEYILINGDTYTACYDSGFHAKDRDRILGCVVFENVDTDPMIVYSIKGVEDMEYIYTLWVYDGNIYKKNTE